MICLFTVLLIAPVVLFVCEPFFKDQTVVVSSGHHLHSNGPLSQGCRSLLEGGKTAGIAGVL